MLRWHRPLAYGIALLAALIASVLRYWLDPVLPPGFPFLTFFPAVIVTAFVAGTGPGVACAVLSGLAAWYLFIPPVNSFALEAQSAVALLFYAGIVGVDIVLIHLMQRAAGRLAEAQVVTAGLLQQQRLMFQELQHRVANNMAFVSSLLNLQKRRVMAKPETAVGALDEASTRLNTMARIHRRLYDPASVELPVGQYLKDICTDLCQAADAHNIDVLVDMPPVRLDISRRHCHVVWGPSKFDREAEFA
ncbi:histidine kinase dimerization/phosphoacceptor domain -containing protein [Muricoccus vinaceus]|uniref:histidine kinase n=1 Tax=Muricoccus vinaceus TaxID=424704 RepID=A0ABV6IWK1_9PROT